MATTWRLSLDNGDTLHASSDISPDALVMEWNNGFRSGEVQQYHQYHHHHHRGSAYEHHAPSHHQPMTVDFPHQDQRSQPPPQSIDLHSTPVGLDWTTSSQHGLPSLPPTPISAYSPLKPLTEADSIVDSRFTGQHRGDWDPESFPIRNTGHPCTPDISQVDGLCSRRQSAPTSSDVNPSFLAMTKCKTDPGEAYEMESVSSYVGRQSRRSPSSGTGRRSSVQHSHLAIGKDHHYHQSRRSSVQSIPGQSSRTRVPHNLVERRYRDNLNNQIEHLRLTLPSLRDAQPSPTEVEDTMAMGPRMPSKAVIISTAATYIKDLETERERLLDATKALQEQVSSLQKLVRCEDCSMLGYLNKMQVAN